LDFKNAEDDLQEFLRVLEANGHSKKAEDLKNEIEMF
jgi:hypothetical protein